MGSEADDDTVRRDRSGDVAPYHASTRGRSRICLHESVRHIEKEGYAVTQSVGFSQSANLEPSECRPQITVQLRGTLALNPAAFEALNSPTAVELLFEPDRRIVGLRASTTTAVNAYQVRGAGKPVARYLVAGAAFTRYHGIVTDVARTWYATLQDSILCIDLKTAGIELRRDRGEQPASLNLS